MALSQDQRSTLLKQYKTSGMTNSQALKKVNGLTSYPSTPSSTGSSSGGWIGSPTKTDTTKQTQPYVPPATTNIAKGSTSYDSVKPPEGKIWDSSTKTWVDPKALQAKQATTPTLSPTQNRIVDTQIAQADQMAAAQTQADRDAIYEQNMEARKQTMLEHFELPTSNVSPEYIELFKKKWNPITGKMEGVTPEEWASIPNKFQRDPSLEAQKMSDMGLNTMEGNEGAGYMATYGIDKTNALIDTGQIDPSNFTANELAQLGFTQERLLSLRNGGVVSPELFDNLMQKLQSVGGDLAIADANLAVTPEPTNPSMNVLAEALNAKSNYQDQELGVSDLFTMAGVSGYEVLAQSLNQRSKEMANKTKSAQSLVFESGGIMLDTYKQMAKHSEELNDDYDKLMDQLLGIDRDYRQNELAIDRMQKQYDLDKDLAQFKIDLETKALKDMNDAASDLDNPTWVPGEGFDEALNDEDGYMPVGGEGYKTSFLKDLFNVGGWASWCGVFASKISNAGSVGDSWGEKKSHIDHRGVPTVGDKLLIPWGVKTDKDWGHVAVVLGYDPDSKDIFVVQSNADGAMNRGADRSKITFGTFNADKLDKMYPDNWGYMDGSLVKDLRDSLYEAPASVTGGAMKIAGGDAEGGMSDMLHSFLDLGVNAAKNKVSGIFAGDDEGASAPKTDPTKPYRQRLFEALLDAGDQTNAGNLWDNESSYVEELLAMPPEAREAFLQSVLDETAKKSGGSSSSEPKELDASEMTLYAEPIQWATKEVNKGATPIDVWGMLQANYGATIANKIMKEIRYESGPAYTLDEGLGMVKGDAAQRSFQDNMTSEQQQYYKKWGLTPNTTSPLQQPQGPSAAWEPTKATGTSSESSTAASGYRFTVGN